MGFCLDWIGDLRELACRFGAVKAQMLVMFGRWDLFRSKPAFSEARTSGVSHGPNRQYPCSKGCCLLILLKE